MNKATAFSKLPVIKPTDKILLLSHNDVDGSGPAILLNLLFDSVHTIHIGNGAMSWKLRNTICFDDIDDYDIVIACDISCNEQHAERIAKSPNSKKLIILDHHDSAKHLNQYDFACVEFNLFEDSAIAPFYKDKASQAHASGTSLMYDYLDYLGYWKNTPYPKSKYDIRKFVHDITAFDTWDWTTLLDSDPHYQAYDKLFDIYSQDVFEDVFLKRMMDCNEDLIRDIDHQLLAIEKAKIKKHISNIAKVMQTGTICINDTYYSIVFCHASQYITDSFEFMKSEYPDYDLYLIDYGLGISIRTESENIHIGMLLKEFGGGGHPGAGGIRYTMENKLELISKTLGESTIVFDKKETFV